MGRGHNKQEWIKMTKQHRHGMTTWEIFEMVRSRMVHLEPRHRRFKSRKNRVVKGPPKPMSIIKFSRWLGVGRATYHRWQQNEAVPLNIFLNIVIFRLHHCATLVGNRVVINGYSYVFSNKEAFRVERELAKEVFEIFNDPEEVVMGVPN